MIKSRKNGFLEISIETRGASPFCFFVICFFSFSYPI